MNTQQKELYRKLKKQIQTETDELKEASKKTSEIANKLFAHRKELIDLLGRQDIYLYKGVQVKIINANGDYVNVKIVDNMGDRGGGYASAAICPEEIDLIRDTTPEGIG